MQGSPVKSGGGLPTRDAHLIPSEHGLEAGVHSEGRLRMLSLWSLFELGLLAPLRLCRGVRLARLHLRCGAPQTGTAPWSARRQGLG
jgi:hypothetical protein